MILLPRYKLVNFCIFASDKEMILELERLRVRYGMCGKERSPSRLDAFVKSLEEERDYFKQEAERYRKTRGGSDRSPIPSPSRGRSPKGRGNWQARVRPYVDTPVHKNIQLPFCSNLYHMARSMWTLDHFNQYGHTSYPNPKPWVSI